jgi:hypothetical protein
VPEPAGEVPREIPADDEDGGTGGGGDEEEVSPSSPTATENECRTHNVDLLFVIDNSGSMSQEQGKLSRTVPELLAILATGNRNGKRSPSGEPTDFAPAESIHVGVVSTDMGVNLAPAPNSCGERSFVPNSDPRTSTARLNKPFGDDGALLNSSEVAVAGISVLSGFDELTQVVPPDPTCAELELAEPYLSYTPGDMFEDTGHAFSCISKLGRTGCGLEQQLESMLKALTPAESRVTFSRDTQGQGTAKNAGFLREDAVLAIIHISDEEDCSIPDESSGLFDPTSTQFPGGINVRCGLPGNQSALHDVERYAQGLRSLKPSRYRDRILFGGVVGAPTAANSGLSVHSGEQLDELLARPDMHFSARRNPAETDDEPVPVCVSAQGDGSAAPGRRFVQLAASFGDNGLVSSICDDGYRPLVTQLSERIARHLGDCDDH